MITVQEAYNIIDKYCPVLPAIKIKVGESLGYALSGDIVSPDTIPAFDNSAMDGFAVCAHDVSNAGHGSPVTLKIVGEAPAGKPSDIILKPGEAIHILTGGMIPKGADSVVKIEDTKTIKAGVKIFDSPEPGLNIRRAGEDIKSGDKLFSKGHVIKPADMGILASAGISEVPVHKKPVVAFLVTGSELIGPDEPLTAGKIRDSNGYSISGLLKSDNIDYLDIGLAIDNPGEIRYKLGKGLDADLIITSGAVSVGKYDYVKDALSILGMKTLFWKVLQRPGKPLLFGSIGLTLVLGLPGNPVSVMVTYILYARAIIRKMMGCREYLPKTFKGRLSVPYSKPEELTFFARGEYKIENGLVTAAPFEKQGSGILRSMSRANCIIIFEDGRRDFSAGSHIDILPL